MFSQKHHHFKNGCRLFLRRRAGGGGGVIPKHMKTLPQVLKIVTVITLTVLFVS